METMARKNKIGLDYFPFEVSFFSDLKIRRLIRKSSSDAVAVYSYLLCLIYERGYYLEYNTDLNFIIHEGTGVEESKIEAILVVCTEVELFDKQLFHEHNIITSKGIQERFEYVNKICKRKAIVSEYNLIPSEEIPQRKEKERKVKEINLEFIEPDFANAFNKWLEYKKQIGKYYKVQWSIEAAYKDMKGKANNSPKTAMLIVDQSISREWDGLYGLKNDFVEQSTSTKEKLCQWEIPKLGDKRKGSYEQYEADVKRNAPLQVNFLGYVE